MKISRFALLIASGALLVAAPAFPQGEKEGQGTAIVTILPKHAGDPAPSVAAQSLSLKVNGKTTTVSGFAPLNGANNSVELVLLIDSSSRDSLGQQFDQIAQFFKSLPPSVKVAVGYMQNGHAAMAGPLTSDHAAALKGLRLPAGTVGSNGSPYFCLSDLATRWPSGDPAARREVVMVTDGVDEYNRRFDPEDPYVATAVRDSVKAGLVVYTIYWSGRGRADSTLAANSAGQNLLLAVTDATGGKSFWEGTGNPVTFAPYFEELSRRLRNQYELSFIVPFNGKPQVEDMKLKFSAPGEEVVAPRKVFVSRVGVAQNQ